MCPCGKDTTVFVVYDKVADAEICGCCDDCDLREYGNSEYDPSGFKSVSFDQVIALRLIDC
jgi:hypothetical protein